MHPLERIAYLTLVGVARACDRALDLGRAVFLDGEPGLRCEEYSPTMTAPVARATVSALT